MSSNGKGLLGEALATSGITYGGYFKSNSTSGRGVIGVAETSTGTNYGVYGKTKSPSGYGVYSQGNMKVVGAFTCTGTKSAVVKLNNGEGVSLYAVEATGNWFEDFGSSNLADGKAVVEIDPTYAQTVNTDMAYHVFLTPEGDCKGLYVIHKKGSCFEVRELNGGKSNIPFSYRIVAKRKGYEDLRLSKANEDITAAMSGSEGGLEKIEGEKTAQGEM
jgi:hypothetical protein